MATTSSDIRRAAMDLLARREHGSKELCDKLSKRFRKIEASAAKSAAKSIDSGFLDVGLFENGQPEALSVDETNRLSLTEKIEIEVAKLTSDGLQSDERLAEAFIRSRANRGQGPVKIKAELRQKGIPDQIMSQAMEQTEQDWFALAKEVADKKFRRWTTHSESEDESALEENAPPKLEAKERAKRSRFLQQRGFTFDHISALED